MARVTRSTPSETACAAPDAARVLVADDHADSRLLVQTFLSLLGFAVRTVADGREALQVAEEFHPNIVFLDLWMPGMDGVEACMRLRSGPCPKPIPIFAVTADLVWADELNCFDRVLKKPVDLDELAHLIRHRDDKGHPAAARFH